MRSFIVFVESENDKMSERGKGWDEMTLHPLFLSLNSFYDVTMLHVNGRILAILLTPPIKIVLTTIWCPILVICHVLLEVFIKKQDLRHHRQVLDGPPAAVI